jgi:hypothetical protein
MTSTVQFEQRTGAVRAEPSLRLAGAAGLGYVIAAGVENMELLGAPLPGAAAADIRAAYADQALAAVTWSAGVVSLLLYVVFVASLAPRLRWPRAALAGGIVGPALALAGVIANAPLVLDAGLSDDTVVAVADAQQSLRQSAGPFMALFLFCLGASDVLPGRLSRAARAIAVPLALTPLAAVTDAHWMQVAAVVAFGLHALVVWLASLWLIAGGGVAPAVLIRRAVFLMVAVAAGLVGVALLIVPGATGTYFAWGLAPDSLAAFAGGVYVGSAALYAAGLRAPWRQARALVAAAAVLSVSVCVVTLAHLELFDFDRLQTWAWLVLFPGFALATSGLLIVGLRPLREHDGVALAGWIRAMLGIVAAVLAAIGVGLWIDPVGLPPLGGRFAGSWTVMLGFLAGWAAIANRRDEARLPALALIALPAGALVAALRTMEVAPAYVAGLALLVACGAAVLHATRRA